MRKNVDSERIANDGRDIYINVSKHLNNNYC